MGPQLASDSQSPTVPATCWDQGLVLIAAHPRKWDKARKRVAPLPVTQRTFVGTWS